MNLSMLLAKRPEMPEHGILNTTPNQSLKESG